MRRMGVELAPGTEIARLDAGEKQLVDRKGTKYRYEKPAAGHRRDAAPPDDSGGDLEGVSYYRYLADYQHIRHLAREGATAVVIGGGFIGSEMAAALAMNGVAVTMVFPDEYISSRVFPPGPGGGARARSSSATGWSCDPASRPWLSSGKGGSTLRKRRRAAPFRSDMVIVGVGIDPNTELAAQAGLELGDGIIVDEFLRTSDPDIYAAGDLANFPYLALGHRARVEHWDNAIEQGKCAGRNMAGASQPYEHMPYFFSDLFAFGYEAVGEVTSRLRTLAVWEKPFDKGVVYYLGRPSCARRDDVQRMEPRRARPRVDSAGRAHDAGGADTRSSVG